MAFGTAAHIPGVIWKVFAGSIGERPPRRRTDAAIDPRPQVPKSLLPVEPLFTLFTRKLHHPYAYVSSPELSATTVSHVDSGGNAITPSARVVLSLVARFYSSAWSKGDKKNTVRTWVTISIPSSPEPLSSCRLSRILVD